MTARKKLAPELDDEMEARLWAQRIRDLLAMAPESARELLCHIDEAAAIVVGSEQEVLDALENYLLDAGLNARAFRGREYTCYDRVRRSA